MKSCDLAHTALYFSNSLTRTTPKCSSTLMTFSDKVEEMKGNKKVEDWHNVIETTGNMGKRSNGRKI